MRSPPSASLPFQQYLEALHARLAPLRDGQVARYIPELSRADPDAFGIALVTVDGTVYQAGDSRLPFTVQSISKALVYGMALEDRGVDGVFEKVGVEPSGEAFNSISLEPDSGRPLNPMINAGAIATTGLLHAGDGAERLASILKRFERYVGHPLSIDEAVYASERDTGHRNRAIAHLLRNADILGPDPESVLNTYFQQCSINVTARDLALMGACLANNGVNPITGVVALDARHARKVLSVMATCGMYDYSGHWLFNVGMPAKSGVGGGIMAVLPGQFGLGIFSPPLDARGNSVRGIQVCEAISRDYGLHLFQVAQASSTSVLRLSFDGAQIGSRRVLFDYERRVLQAHGASIRVHELQGELMFASTDSVIRRVLDSLPDTRYAIVDFRRVVDVDHAATRLLAELATTVAAAGVPLLFTGTDDKYLFRKRLGREGPALDLDALLRFSESDRALQWCEDELIRLHAPERIIDDEVPLERQYLFEDLSADEMARVRTLCRERRFPAGATLFRAGDEGTSLFMIVSGAVDIVVCSVGKREQRVNSLRAGMSLGEYALVTGSRRSADARATVDTRCYELAFADIDEGLRNRIAPHLTREMAVRLAKDTREVQVLGGHA